VRAEDTSATPGAPRAPLVEPRNTRNTRKWAVGRRCRRDPALAQAEWTARGRLQGRFGVFRVFRGLKTGSLAAAGALALAGCGPREAAAPQPVGLACGAGFEVLSQRIVGQPGLVPAPKDPNEPYRFYSMADGATSYLITEPGAPGHPAIMMQRARGAQVATTGCRYGDQKGYAQLLAYLDSLKTWTRK
jgi:hypothetical protein